MRTYSGADLLSVYYDYILWVEQNYPLGGNEANLKTLLEKCIEQFYTTDQYRNDQRLLEVFFKLIKRVDSPLELFTFFHDNGFATKLSQFYINWSFHLENHKNCRKAAEVLRKGLQEKAQPMASLKRTLEELEVRVAKAIANDQIEELNDNNVDEEHRKPLNNLKLKTKRGKTVAPVKRIGNAVKSAEGLKTTTATKVQNKAPVVYCDENDPEVVPRAASTARPEPTPNVKAIAAVGQENEQKAGKWTEKALTQKRVATESQPKFTIHADESDDDSPEPVKKSAQSNTLKLRPKNADSPPIARFEKPDPFKRFYCNMNKVYAGGEEFSFEEIRGRKWMAKKKREEEALRNKKLEDEVAQLRAQVELLLKVQMAQQNPPPIAESVPKPAVPQRQEVVSPLPSSADSSAAKSTTSSGNGTKADNSFVRGLWNGTLGNQTTDFHQNGAALDINEVIDRTEEQVRQKKPQFEIFRDTTIVSKAADSNRGRESIGFGDYTIALPKTEQTFIANTHCSSTPMANKSKKSVDHYNAVQSIQNNYNFVGGLTAKLTPIVETSREYNSKSSSSSSGTMSTTGGSALSRRQRAISGVDYSDPFDANLLTHLIATLPEPIHTRKGFFRVKKSLPKIKQRETVVKLGADSYLIDRLIATGAYAQVFTAQIDDTANSMDEESTNSSGFSKFISQKWFALKVAKNANEWEFYICDELHKRLNRSKTLPDIV